MKQQRQEQVQQQEQVLQQSQVKEVVRKIQHPQEQYLVNQVFSIRKQSSSMANDHIYKRLTKSFHRIKKLRADPNASTLISKQYDYENNPIRQTLKKAHQLYNVVTRTNLIVKRKIDKMRGKVDRIKSEVESSELSLISEVDVNKIYSRSTQPPAINPQNQLKDKPK